MSDGDLLLRAILSRPEDDTARLVYADWLDENGQGERAEFIRVQVELERIRPDADPKRGVNLATGRYVTPPLFPRWKELDARRRELWAHSVTALAPSRRIAFQWFPVPDGCELMLDAASPIAFIRFPGNGQDGRLDINRGFGGSLRILANDWFAHADALCDSHPIASVRLANLSGPDIDRLCAIARGRFGPLWFDGSQGCGDVLCALWPGISFTLPP